MSINKPDPEILKVFWWNLDEDVRHQIVKDYHQEYNDFLNGKFIGVFSEELKKLIKLDDIFLNSAEKGLIKVVKSCIELGADINGEYDSALGWASLGWASRFGHLEVVKYLVEKGADIHAKNYQALRWAVNYGHLEVVKYLVDCGADIHANGDEAIRSAAHSGHTEIVEYLKSLS